MASSENLASMAEPWSFRPAFADHPWLSEAFARETETLTMALQKSLPTNHSSTATAAAVVTDTLYTFPNPAKPEPTSSSVAQTPSASGSEPEASAPKRRISAVPGPAARGKIPKRKSRASKRTTTTFITADPANFRRMVQQVTGARFANGQLPVPQLLKPEPHRSLNRLQGCLPTLDTSAFLLDHHQQQHVVGTTSDVAEASISTMVQPSITVSQPPLPMVADCGAGFDFDSFSCFPTLESWKVM